KAQLKRLYRRREERLFRILRRMASGWFSSRGVDRKIFSSPTPMGRVKHRSPTMRLKTACLDGRQTANSLPSTPTAQVLLKYGPSSRTAATPNKSLVTASTRLGPCGHQTADG